MFALDFLQSEEVNKKENKNLIFFVFGNNISFDITIWFNFIHPGADLNGRCGGDNWIAYENSKCFKLIKDFVHWKMPNQFLKSIRAAYKFSFLFCTWVLHNSSNRRDQCVKWLSTSFLLRFRRQTSVHTNWKQSTVLSNFSQLTKLNFWFSSRKYTKFMVDFIAESINLLLKVQRSNAFVAHFILPQNLFISQCTEERYPFKSILLF